MKIIACYSNKGGVGKTASSVNLAYGLAASGLRTLLCDLDPQGAAGFYFGVKPSKKLTEGRFFEDSDKFVKAIRPGGYANLDVLAANHDFRDFDQFLSRMKGSRSRLKQALKTVRDDYDVVVLDCPPNISILSENIFRAADAVLVPVIPTTLSQRSFEQLLEFFEENDLPADKLHAFFSMVQSVKSLHGQTMTQMRADHPGHMMRTHIPFASDMERMGVRGAPVLASAPNCPASRASAELRDELLTRI